ncbi:MAG: DUF692 domain-containing protein [Pseudomonadota bacterium]
MGGPLQTAPEMTGLPRRAGVGLREDHYEGILDNPSDTTSPGESQPCVNWFEFHPENYMGDGGAPHHYLARVAERFPLSMHGVGLSIGAAGPLNKAHLNRLKGLNERYQPAAVSEHLAWSTHESHYMNDLLPLPFNQETLLIVCDHIDEVQAHLGRTILLENPSSYLAFQESDMDEVTFLDEVARRTGCGLLLDVNNVFVSATNMDWSAEQYIDAFPKHRIGEIHLAGHDEQALSDGSPFLIDSHDREVANDVWALFEQVIESTGPIPTLIEWDADIPAWPVLVAEAARADRVLLSSQRAGYALAG